MTRDPSDGSIRPTINRIEMLREKHGPNWGLDVGEKKRKPPELAPTPEELKQHYARFNLEFRPKEETGQ